VKQVFGPSAADVIGFSALVRDGSGQPIGCWRRLATASLIITMPGDAARDLGNAGYPGTTFLVVDSTGRQLAEGGQSIADSVLTDERDPEGSLVELKEGRSGDRQAQIAAIMPRWRRA